MRRNCLQLLTTFVPYLAYLALGSVLLNTMNGVLADEKGSAEGNLEPGLVRHPDAVFEHTDRATCVASSSNGNLLAAGGANGAIRIWDVSTGRLKRDLKAHSRTVRDVAFSPDGRLIATSGDDNIVHLWNVVTGDRVQSFIGHLGESTSVAFSKNGKQVFTSSADRTLRLWDITSGRELRRFYGHERQIAGAALLSEGDLAVSASYDGSLKLWDVKGGVVPADDTRHSTVFQGDSTSDVKRIAVSPDCQLAAVITLGGRLDMLPISTLDPGWTSVSSVSFSPDGRWLAVAGKLANKRTVGIVNMATGRQEHEIADKPNQEITCLTFSRDSLKLTAGFEKGAIASWDMKTGKQLTFAEGHREAVRSLNFSPDSGTLVSGADDGTVKVWEAFPANLLHDLVGHKGAVRGAIVTQDNQYVASTGDDGTVRIWSKESGEMLGNQSLDGHGLRRKGQALLQVPGSQELLVIVADGTARLLDIRSGKVTSYRNGQAGITEHKTWLENSGSFDIANNEAVMRVVESTEPLVWVNEKDGSSRISQASSGRQVLRVPAQSDGSKVYSVSADGIVLTVNSDKPMRLWRIPRELLFGRVQFRSMASGELLAEPNPQPESAEVVVFSPDSRKVLVGGHAGVLHVYDSRTGRLLAKLEGHTGIVRAAVFFGDGRFIVSSADDGTARVWETETKKQLQVFNGHGRAVTTVDVSSSGEMVATGGHDHTIRVWDTATGQQVAKEQTSLIPTSLRFFDATVADSGASKADLPRNRFRLLIATADAEIRLWDLATHREPLSYVNSSNARIYDLAYSVDGRWVAAASADSTIRLYDAVSGRTKAELKGHAGAVTSLAFNRAGDRLVSVGTDNTLHVWAVPEGREIATFSGSGLGFWSAAFDPAGQMVAGGTRDGRVYVWDMKNENRKRVIDAHAGLVAAVGFHGDGDRLWTASEDGTLAFWDVQTGKLVNRVRGPGVGILTAAISKDEKLVATSDRNGRVYIWSPGKAGAFIEMRHSEGLVWSLEFSPDGERLLTGGTDLAARIWSTKSGQLLSSFTDHDSPVWSVTFSPNGQSITAGTGSGGIKTWQVSLSSAKNFFSNFRTLTKSHNDRAWRRVAHSPQKNAAVFNNTKNQIQMIDLSSGQIRTLLTQHQGEVRDLVLLPDGRQVMTAGSDGSIRLTTLAAAPRDDSFLTMNTRFRAVVPTCVAISPNGLLALSGHTDGISRLWDLKTGTESRRLFIDRDVPLAAAFSSDGTLVASGTSRGDIVVTKIFEDGRDIRLTGHQGAVRDVCFLPKKHLLASAGDDHKVLVWKIPISSDAPLKTPVNDLVEKATDLREVRVNLTRSTDRLSVSLDGPTSGSSHGVALSEGASLLQAVNAGLRAEWSVDLHWPAGDQGNASECVFQWIHQDGSIDFARLKKPSQEATIRELLIGESYSPPPTITWKSETTLIGTFNDGARHVSDEFPDGSQRFIDYNAEGFVKREGFRPPKELAPTTHVKAYWEIQERPSLGVALTDALVSGPVVARVLSGSSAEKSGLKKGDVILQVDGRKVSDSKAVQKVIGEHLAGDRLILQVKRSDDDISLPVTLGALSSESSRTTNIVRRVEVPDTVGAEKWTLRYNHGAIQIFLNQQLVANAFIPFRRPDRVLGDPSPSGIGTSRIAAIGLSILSGDCRCSALISRVTPGRPPLDVDQAALAKRTRWLGLDLSNISHDVMRFAFENLDNVRRAYGPSHVDYALALYSYGQQSLRNGDSTSRQYLVQALQLGEDLLGEDHPETARYRYAVALQSATRADFLAARRDIARVAVVRRDYFGAHSKEYAEALLDLARIAQTPGDHTFAQTQLQQFLDFGAPYSDEQRFLRAQAMHAAGNHHLALCQYREANRSFADAVKEFEGASKPYRLERLLALSGAAVACSRFGDNEAAANFAERAYKLIEGKDESNPLAMDAAAQLGFVTLVARDVKQGLFWLDKAFRSHVHINATLMTTASEGEVLLAAKATIQNLHDLLLAYELQRESSPNDLTEIAFQRLLDGRGTASQLLVDRHRRYRSTLELQERVVRLHQVRSKLAELTMPLSSARTQNPATHQSDVERLVHDKEGLELAIAIAVQEQNRDVSRPLIKVSDLGSHLPEKTALVSFLIRADRHSKWQDTNASQSAPVAYVDAFVLRKRLQNPGYSVIWVNLGDARQIETAVDQWRGGLVKWASQRGLAILGDTLPKEEVSFDQAALDLRKLLWAKIEPHLDGCTTVLLVPDGALTRIPFAALPGRKPATFLIHDYAVGTLAYPQQLMEFDEGLQHTEAASILLVGDVDFDKSDRSNNFHTDIVPETIKPSVNDNERSRWSFLPGTKSEIEAIVAIAGKRIIVHELRGSEATEDRLRQEIGASRYVHVATHGYFANENVRSVFQANGQLQLIDANNSLATAMALVHDRNPLLLAGLVLAGANRTLDRDVMDRALGRDGILTGEEILDLPMQKTDLVVLSACETGLGRVAGGEGAFGLQRACTLAGAKTVVASLWKVDDAATKALMAEFYHNLWDKKLGKLESLRQAQIKMMTTYDPESHAFRSSRGLGQSDESQSNTNLSPFYWAAFSLSGDWR